MGVYQAGSHDFSHGDSWVNEISASLSVGEECIKEAEALKCYMEAGIVFQQSYNKSDK